MVAAPTPCSPAPVVAALVVAAMVKVTEMATEKAMGSALPQPTGRS
jgi:hypothetical protein